MTKGFFALRRHLLRTTVALTAAVGLAGLADIAPAVAMDAQITVKGGQVRGAFNRTASAWAAYATQNVPGVKASAEASAGSLDNIRTVGGGKAELGLAFASDMYNAYRGQDAFKQAYKNMRAVTFLMGSVGHFVVPADSDIKALEDIKGKTISMGGPGSGSAKSLTALLQHMGLWGQFTPVYAGRKSPEQLKAGKVAAYNWHPGLGNAMIRDTASSMKIRFINMDAPAKASGFYDKFPYFGPTVIPAGTYPGVDVDTPTFGTGTVMISHAGVSEDVIYKITKGVFSDAGKKFLVSSAGKVANQMTLENAFRTVSIPLHPGAAKFFAEAGVSIPAELKPGS